MRTLASLWTRSRILAYLSAIVVLTACGEPAPRFTEPQVLGGQTVSAEVLNRGARIYALYCVSCHGIDGSGQGNASRSLSTPPRDFREASFKYRSTPEGSLPTDEDLDFTVRKGRVDTGMPAWNGLVDEDRHAVIQYLKTFSPRWKTEAPKAPAELEP